MNKWTSLSTDSHEPLIWFSLTLWLHLLHCWSIFVAVQLDIWRRSGLHCSVSVRVKMLTVGLLFFPRLSFQMTEGVISGSAVTQVCWCFWSRWGKMVKRLRHCRQDDICCFIFGKLFCMLAFLSQLQTNSVLQAPLSRAFFFLFVSLYPRNMSHDPNRWIHLGSRSNPELYS